MGRFVAALGHLALAIPCATAGAQITTSQYDNLRTGATLTEKTLTPKNVNVQQFGKLGAFKVDGPVYAQPLLIPSLDIPGKGKHDVIFIATEHDSVYAFDADRPNDAPLWHVSFLDRKRSVAAVPARDVQCAFIQPEIGVTSTPVVDLNTGTLYVLARSMSDPLFGDKKYFQHLHALAITTGAEKFGGPKLISASALGRGEGGANGQVAFSPLHENPRAALLLANNALYLTWGSSCDAGPYHGWVMAYDARTLAQKAALNVTPDGGEGGIWASDTGPASDQAGNIYVPTGNGTFDASSGGRDFGDSVLKLALLGSSLAVRDFFTPYNQSRLNDDDFDLGSSGPLLLPDQPGPHPHLLLQPSKGRDLYVIDRDRMGQFQSAGDAIIQRIRMAGNGYGAMAYWNRHVFFVCDNDYLRDYAVTNGELKLNAYSSSKFANPGATPSISANGSRDAIVWTISTRNWDGPDQPAVFYAFDANQIGPPIYTSEQNSKRDRAALATRFAIPAVMNGRVYFGARGEVEVYGLLK
jgi:hypothetical protein